MRQLMEHFAAPCRAPLRAQWSTPTASQISAGPLGGNRALQSGGADITIMGRYRPQIGDKSLNGRRDWKICDAPSIREQKHLSFTKTIYGKSKNEIEYWPGVVSSLDVCLIGPRTASVGPMGLVLWGLFYGASCLIGLETHPACWAKLPSGSPERPGGMGQLLPHKTPPSVTRGKSQVKVKTVNDFLVG